MLKLEEAVADLAKEPELWSKQLNPGATRFGLPLALGRAETLAADLVKNPVIPATISVLKADLAKKKQAQTEIPVADQADFSRQIGLLEERLEVVSRGYSAAINGLQLQRQTLAAWLKVWEAATALEGEAEANKRMAALIARAKTAKETARNVARTNPPAQQQTPPDQAGKTPVAVPPNPKITPQSKPAAMRGPAASKLAVVPEAPAPPEPSPPEERLISLEEAASFKGAEPGSRLYLSGEFVVTASTRNRAVLRSAFGDPVSLGARIFVEYGAGSSPPPQGSTLSQNSLGHFEVREVRRWTPSERPPNGLVEIFVKEGPARP